MRDMTPRCKNCEWFKAYPIPVPPCWGACHEDNVFVRIVSKEDYDGPVDCKNYWPGKEDHDDDNPEIDSIQELFDMQLHLMTKVPGGDILEPMSHQITCALGIIEETIEYLNSLGRKPWRPIPLPPEKQKEELVDILHFIIELIIRSPFPWDEIVEEFRRKHIINLKRYSDGAKGDFSWDHKGTKDEL